MKLIAFGAQLTGWVDKTGGGTHSMATSWVFDLMQAAQQTNAALGRGKAANTQLWFNGAGNLGTRLDLGINTSYISDTNQKTVDGSDRVLGVIPTQADSSIPNQAAYTAGSWNLTNAQALAAQLKGLSRAAPGPVLLPDNNPQGSNRQDQALLDFLSVYAATQAVGSDAAHPNGTWGQLQLKYATGEYKKALFGDGTQGGGLINARTLMLGGTAAPLGAAMTAESLAKFMNPDSTVNGVNYADWVKPLQDAMTAYGINTPKQIAAFMAQIKQETAGLQKMREDIGPYRVSVLIDTFAGMFGGKTLTREQRFANLKIFMRDVLRLTALEGKQLSDSGVENYRPSVEVWNTVRDTFADYYLSNDKGTKGQPKGNGNAADAIAHNWIGGGVLHVTHFATYAGFFYDLSRKLPDLIPEFKAQTQAEVEVTLKANPSLTSLLSANSVQGRQVAALAGAWFWSTHGDLNKKATNIVWQNNAVEATQKSAFNQVSSVINQGNAFDERWKNYTKNVDALLKGGNPYESMRAALARVGLTTNTGKAYSQQFGVALALRKPMDIQGEHATQLLAAPAQALLETPDGPDLSEAQQAQLWAQAEPLPEQLKSSKETSTMWIPNLRTDTALLVGTVMAVATASPVQAANKYVLGMCETARQGEGAEIRPIEDANSYLYDYQRSYALKEKFNFKSNDGKDTKVTLVKAPKHGRVALADVPDVDNGQYHYFPEGAFSLTDNFVMQVEKDGVKVRIYYLIQILEGDEPSIGRCKTAEWKISQSNLAPSTQDLAAWQRSTALSGLIAAASHSVAGFEDLAGSSVGQTNGSGATAHITLDADAAGHGWYVDPKPLDPSTSSGLANSDYLPTSNPGIWQAKAGSAADGKMDLLSVLLHEYGHALGPVRHRRPRAVCVRAFLVKSGSNAHPVCMSSYEIDSK